MHWLAATDESNVGEDPGSLRQRGRCNRCRLFHSTALIHSVSSAGSQKNQAGGGDQVVREGDSGETQLACGTPLTLCVRQQLKEQFGTLAYGHQNPQCSAVASVAGMCACVFCCMDVHCACVQSMSPGPELYEVQRSCVLYHRPNMTIFIHHDQSPSLYQSAQTRHPPAQCSAWNLGCVLCAFPPALLAGLS